MGVDNPLVGKGLLTSLQRSFLVLFSQIKDKNQFYLTGGTALSEYYLGHRLSFDLDIFTSVESLILPVSYQIEQLSKQRNLEISAVRRFASYVEYSVSDKSDRLRVELALDSPFRFVPPVATQSGMLVNSERDLFVDKLLAFYGRAEPRDAVDLYFILQKVAENVLLEQAAQKDPGFDKYWFAIALNRCSDYPDELNRWPVKMLVPFEPIRLKADFHSIAVRIMGDIEKGEEDRP